MYKRQVYVLFSKRDCLWQNESRFYPYDIQNIIHFAAFKNHMGLYPGSEAIEQFAEQLKPYKTSKGAIQFQYKEPVPFELIAEIATWCYITGNHH